MVLICVLNILIFLKYMEFNLMKEAGNKRSSFSDDSKYGAFILGQ